jgi:hypothetical protein
VQPKVYVETSGAAKAETKGTMNEVRFKEVTRVCFQLTEIAEANGQWRSKTEDLRVNCSIDRSWFGYCFTPTDTEAYKGRLVTLY